MPRISPDERWLAYSAQASGEPEVYLCGYPSLGDPSPVSRGGGRSPAWRGDSRALYYIRPSPPALMEVQLAPGSRAGWQEPKQLFELPKDFLIYTELGLIARDLGTGFDVARDGARFVFVRRLDMDTPQPPRHINVVENWPALLKKR